MSPALSLPVDHGLKEWDAVVRALGGGRQMLLIRKGGIHETEGRFEIEHRRFVLFPTWLHQRVDWVREADRVGVHPRTSEPDEIGLSVYAEVNDIVRVPGRTQVDALADEMIYLPPLIDMRFAYKPHNPLFILLVRAFTLARPQRVQNTPLYAGCKSWVPFEKPIDVSGATPALDDTAYAVRRERILAILRV
ncbi:MAG TPA: DUF1802 family protein [Tepidisphaeraceae bacterium]|jgi:hypothetical protein